MSDPQVLHGLQAIDQVMQKPGEEICAVIEDAIIVSVNRISHFEQML